MPHKVSPEIYCIGETITKHRELQLYLDSIGVSDWETDIHDCPEEIIEVMGRNCYASFGTSLNDNLTRVREGNKEYLENIIKVKHGSVVEHGFLNFIFKNVSRICTQELIRHRVGVAISEASLRFIRVNDIGYYVPSCFQDDEVCEDILYDSFYESERNYKILLAHIGFKEFGMPGIALPFILNDKIIEDGLSYFNQLSMEKKKEYTSAARRILPMGMATVIGWSANVRTIRHVIEQRTAPWAEEEIRLLFAQVADYCMENYPNLFSDYDIQFVNNIPWYKTENAKV